MRISIITTTYNSSKTIADCIASVERQTHPDIEHIIIDGDSNDNTIEIIKSIPNKVDTIISEPDKGIYYAMNKGLSLATGDIIGILNSDDLLASENTINQIIEVFATTDCDAVFGNLDFVAAGNIEKVIRHWKSSPYEPGCFQSGWHPPHPTFFVKKEIYSQYGKFDTSFEISADFELMLRFIETHKIKTVYLDNTLVKMRYGGVSTTSLKGILLGNRNVLSAFKKNGIRVSPFYTLNRMAYKSMQFIKK